MAKRILSILLLVLTMMQALLVARGQRPDVMADERITPEEKQEALEIAEKFVKGFEERNNLPAMMDELYVREFEARLRSRLNEYAYVVSVEQEAIDGASREDLRRFYAAALGFYYVGTLLYGAEAYRRKQAGDTSRQDEPGIHDLLPPNVIDVLRGEPVLAQMVAEAEDEEIRRRNLREGKEAEQVADKERRAETEVRGNALRSVEELRLYISTLEKANALTRAHLKTLAVPQTWQEMIRAISEPEERNDNSGNDVCSYMCPTLTIVQQDSPGLAKGTRLIQMKVLAFDMTLVRIDGKLRIYNVSLVD